MRAKKQKPAKRITFTTTNAIVIGQPVIFVIPAKVLRWSDGKVMIVDQCSMEYKVPYEHLIKLPVYPDISSQNRKRATLNLLFDPGDAVIATVPGNVTAIEPNTIIVTDKYAGQHKVAPDYIHFFPPTYPEIPFVRHKAKEIGTDDWACPCGNDGAFSPCDKQGNEIEINLGSAWRNLIVCDDCGNIINQDTLDIIGKNPKPSPLSHERKPRKKAGKSRK